MVDYVHRHSIGIFHTLMLDVSATNRERILKGHCVLILFDMIRSSWSVLRCYMFASGATHLHNVPMNGEIDINQTSIFPINRDGR